MILGYHKRILNTDNAVYPTKDVNILVIVYVYIVVVSILLYYIIYIMLLFYIACKIK